MRALMTTSEVAREISESELIPGTVREHQIRRVFEYGDLPEPDRLKDRRALTPDMLPAIIEACRRRGWLPRPELEAVEA